MNIAGARRTRVHAEIGWTLAALAVVGAACARQAWLLPPPARSLMVGQTPELSFPGLGKGIGLGLGLVAALRRGRLYVWLLAPIVGIGIASLDLGRARAQLAGCGIPGRAGHPNWKRLPPDWKSLPQIGSRSPQIGNRSPQIGNREARTPSAAGKSGILVGFGFLWVNHRRSKP